MKYKHQCSKADYGLCMRQNDLKYYPLSFKKCLGIAWLCVWSPVFQQSQVLPTAAVGPAEPRLRPVPSVREPPRARTPAQPGL